MNDATWTGPRCEICGRPVKRNNATGICKVNPECQRFRAERRKRAQGKRPMGPRGTNRQNCKHPDGCPKPRDRQGWCGMHFYRVQRYGDPGPVGHLRKPRVIHTGDTFGRWTALEDFTPKKRNSHIQCRCACGTQRPVDANALLYGYTRSCGCLLGRPRRELKPREPYLLAGFTSGLLVTLEDAAYMTDLVLVRCECGQEARKQARLVKRGQTRSCGCLQLTVRTTHGLSKHPLYHTWRGIIARTSNPNTQSYPNYGGRGVRLHEDWQGIPDGFLRFVEHIGPRPSPQHSVDRYPNKNGDYEPGNVRWATPDEQNGNKRTVEELGRENAELRARIAALEAGALF